MVRSAYKELKVRKDAVVFMFNTTAAWEHLEESKELLGKLHALGCKVGLDHFGERATVTALPPAAERIETGAKTRVLKARLADGSEVTIPRANVELI